MKEKSYVEDIDRSVYDFKDDEKDAYKLQAGLTPEIVEKLSKEKNDPVWMQNFRLQALQIYNEMSVTSKIRLSVSASRRQSGNPLPVSARSTTLNWYTTMCARRLRHRELYTRIWRVP